MNYTNLIREHEDEILAELRKADKLAYLYPSCEYRVYVDTDGEVGHEEWASGDNGWYEFRDPDYDRIYVGTLRHEYYSILWDYWFADSDVFASCFRDRFGVDLQAETDEDGDEIDQPLSDMADYTVKACGISGDDYAAWVAEQTDEAIEQACGETDYYEYIREALREQEFRDQEDD